MNEFKRIILNSIESQKRFHKTFVDLMEWWEDDIPAGIIANELLTDDEKKQALLNYILDRGK